MAALTLLLSGCSQTDDILADQPTKTLRFKATITNDAVTRALSVDGNKIAASWAKDEEVAMIYKIGDENKLTKATVTSVNGSGAAIIEAEVEEGITEGLAVTLVYPYQVASQDHVDDVLVVATQDGDLTTIADNYDVRRGTGAFHVDGETVTLQDALSLSALNAICKFTLKDEDNDPLEVKTFEIYNTDKQYTMAKLSLETPANTFYLAVPALENDKGNAVSFTAETEAGIVYTGSGKTNLKAGKYYTPTVTLAYQAPITVEAVDLGLPSGTKWANVNIGAKTLTDAGKFFAWGATTGYYKSEGYAFTWGNDLLKGDISDSYAGTKYTKGGLEVLADDDDAATRILGDGWSIPTLEQCQELINNTNITWTNDYNDTGVAGAVISYTFLDSKNYTWVTNSIFIPACGYIEGTTLTGDTYANVWVKQLDADDQNMSRYGMLLNFNSGLDQTNASTMVGEGIRWKGYPIRAVRGPIVSNRNGSTSATMNMMGEPVTTTDGEW